MSPSPGDSGWLPVQKVMPPFRGNQHRASVLANVARRPRRDHQQRADRDQHSVAQAALSQQPQSEQQEEEQVRRSRERGQPANTPHHSSHTRPRPAHPDSPQDTCRHQHVREGQRHVQRLGEDVRGRPDQRRIDSGDPGRDEAGVRTGHPVATDRDEPDAKRSDHRLGDLDGGERSTVVGACDRRQEKRIERRAPEPFRLRLAGCGGGIAEAAALHQIGGKRQILALVVRQRLADPVAEPERQPEHQAGQHREPYRSSGAGDHCRLSNRSAEICSETRPTRKITTASMMSSTDELVMCDCVQMVQTA